MLSEYELEALLADIEADRTSARSRRQSRPDRQAICAFANDLPNHRRPGVIFVGARDEGTCAGLAIVRRRP